MDLIVAMVIGPLFLLVLAHTLTYGRRGRRWGMFASRR